MTATGTFTDGTTQDLSAQATWVSANLVNATIDAAGLASGVASGSSDVTASLNGVTSPAVSLTVVSVVDIEITPHVTELFFNGTRQHQLTATAGLDNGTTQDVTASVVWSSSAPEFLAVSNATANKSLAILQAAPPMGGMPFWVEARLGAVPSFPAFIYAFP